MTEPPLERTLRDRARTLLTVDETVARLELLRAPWVIAAKRTKKALGQD